MEQQLGKALLVPVRPLVSCFSSSSAVPGPRCYWADGIGELGLVGGGGVQTGAHIGRE